MTEKYITMTKEQFDSLVESVAEKASDKVVEKLESKLYRNVGKTVIEKGLASIGLAAIAVAFLWQNRLWPFNK